MLRRPPDQFNHPPTSSIPQSTTDYSREACDRNIRSIRDVEVKKVLQPSTYQTSSDALIRALEVKGAYNSSRIFHKVRVTELEMEEHDRIKKILEKLSQQMDGTSQG